MKRVIKIIGENKVGIEPFYVLETPKILEETHKYSNRWFQFSGLHVEPKRLNSFQVCITEIINALKLPTLIYNADMCEFVGEEEHDFLTVQIN